MDIQITSEFIKLDQLLKFAGVAGSGSDAKFIIEDGQVTVNGEEESRRGRKIKPGDHVAVGDQNFYVC